MRGLRLALPAFQPRRVPLPPRGPARRQGSWKKEPAQGQPLTLPALETRAREKWGTRGGIFKKIPVMYPSGKTFGPR